MQPIQATFQNGVITPMRPVELPEGTRVTLWLEGEGKEMPHLRAEDRAYFNQLVVQRAEVFRRLAE